ncbi:MAG: hypothetical protein JWL77_469 [Chthonomonadaceae bacterium]|nr:hypothetical protein [Chthonomonadaceae bacterium]
MDLFGRILLVGWGLLCGPQMGAPKPVAPLWQATGTLLEVCSCSVPCPCNFGQGPSNDYCHTVYAYRLKTARFDGVTLDGLVFGGGEADKGVMGYLDARATPAQRAALEKLALAVFRKGGASSGARAFTWTKIVAESDPQHFKMGFGDTASIAANVLIGRDGKNPIIVENNTTWPVHRFIKAKTTRFDYKDSLGNVLHYEGVNANLGEFKLSSDQAAASSAEKPCCR